jgi:hypothetical protein
MWPVCFWQHIPYRKSVPNNHLSYTATNL